MEYRNDPRWIEAKENWVRDWTNQGLSADLAFKIRTQAIYDMFHIEKEYE